MNRNQAKTLLPIIQAFSEGRIIESSSITDVSKAWREVTDFPIDHRITKAISLTGKKRKI